MKHCFISRPTCGARDYKLQSPPSKWADSCKILDDDIRGNVDTQDLFKDKHGEESDIDMDTNDSRGQKDETLKARTVLDFDCSLALVLLMTTVVQVFCESSLVYANPATGCRLVYDPGGNMFEI